MRVLLMIIAAAMSGIYAQQTAQSRIAPDLLECYTNATLLNRNNLPPTTISVLIDIIRKIEDNPNINLDLRQLSAILLHSYRQDGIEYHPSQANFGGASNVIPFAPTFHSFHRHRLLLTRIIPSNNQVFGNETLPSVLKCALHHMLSTTVDARLRGDESSCNQLSQYRALRTVRQARVKDDVEMMDPALLRSANRNGKMRQFNPNDDVEYTGSYGSKSERQILGESQCPLLDGVVNTPWGAVSAGNTIAGIAAGAELQQIPILQLVKGSVIDDPLVQQSVTSIFPATLAGDLAEAVLIQGTERGSSISIGTAGNWNTTHAPRYYMLHSRFNLEMTDPEIRGDIDGYVLGVSLSATLGTYSSLRLSQLLDMYYSPRNGVFNPSFRACNRRDLSQVYVSNSNLASETYSFTAALDSHMPLPGTITGGWSTLVNSSISNFQAYTMNNINDMNCITTEATYLDTRFKTNLYLVLDSSWQYDTIYQAISYLLETIEVSKYGSSVTLLSAFDGSIVINTTYSIADFHSAYTLSRHQSMLTGVNLETSLSNIRILMHEQLQRERAMNYVGGNATVLLYLVNTGNLQSTPNAWEQARILNETVPDLRMLYATSTNHFDTLWNLVRDMHNDITTISLTNTGANVQQTLTPVVSRIQQTGRRIINPLCGSEYVDASSGTRQFDDFIEPGYINYYALSPNYFFANNDNRRVRISRSGAGSGTLTVCYSRSLPLPRQNSSLPGTDENSIICQNIASSGNVEITLQNACDGYWTIGSCPPLYISVQASAVTSYSAFCNDARVCRFPYDNRYQIQVVELGCYSGSSSLTASMAVVFIAIFTYLYKEL